MTPLKIVDARDTRAVDSLVTPGRQHDRALDRRVRAIVERVREEGDPALERFARRFDRVAGPLEVTGEEMRDGAARVAGDVGRAIRQDPLPEIGLAIRSRRAAVVVVE